MPVGTAAPRRPRRSADAAALAARFRRALMPLVRELRRQVEGDLTPGLMSALATVHREGPLTLGELAASERVSPPMATKLAAALGERGLVERVPCSEDRRVVRLVTTPAGVSVLSGGNAALQLATAPQVRGRVMALYTVVFLGSAPIGGPIVGWVAERFGTPASTALSATAAALAATGLLAALRRLATAPAAAPAPARVAEAAADEAVLSAA